MTAITFTANATTYDVAAVADAATENALQSKGLLVRILRALQQSRMHEARRVIVRCAHLLPEGHAADVLPFIVAEQMQERLRSENAPRGQSMTAIAFTAKAATASLNSFFSAVVAECANFRAGAREGREIEARYDALARKSTAELARRGLTRQDIARAALTGPRR